MFDEIRREIDKIEADLRAGKMDPRRVKYTVDRLIHEANTQATAFRMKLLGPLNKEHEEVLDRLWQVRNEALEMAKAQFSTRGTA